MSEKKDSESGRATPGQIDTRSLQTEAPWQPMPDRVHAQSIEAMNQIEARRFFVGSCLRRW